MRRRNEKMAISGGIYGTLPLGCPVFACEMPPWGNAASFPWSCRCFAEYGALAWRPSWKLDWLTSSLNYGVSFLSVDTDMKSNSCGLSGSFVPAMQSGL